MHEGGCVSGRRNENLPTGERGLFVREIFHSCLFFHRLSARPSSCSSRLSAIEELHSNRVSPVISGPRAPCNRIRPFRAIFVSACKLDGTSETFPEPALNRSFPENVDSGLIEPHSNYFIFGNIELIGWHFFNSIRFRQWTVLLRRDQARSVSFHSFIFENLPSSVLLWKVIPWLGQIHALDDFARWERK